MWGLMLSAVIYMMYIDWAFKASIKLKSHYIYNDTFPLICNYVTDIIIYG